MLNHDHLVCLETNDQIADDGYVLENRKAKQPALLRPVYFTKDFSTKPNNPGMYRYAQRLPINRFLEGSAAPVTYLSTGFADRLGLTRLFITFNGYWPEKGAYVTTGTFKEYEAYAVCARMPKDADRVLTVASAGNTARAFIKVCSENRIPLAVVVPNQYMDAIWAHDQVASCVKVIAAGGDSDYADAIKLASIIAELDGFVNEGGAKNVARRAGMGVTVFSCVDEIGQIPELYFQAVGSGTGAIAAHEANLQLSETGRYGTRKMRLILSQNHPFVPMHIAWHAGSRILPKMEEDEALAQISQISATVLSNRNPPYGIKGGVYDCLADTQGDVVPVTNKDAAAASELFFKTEGVLPCPESAVALGSLIRMVQNHEVDKDALIMMNMTGGGGNCMLRDLKTRPLKPSVVIDKSDFHPDTVRKKLSGLF